jgi:hypothetical protein
MRYWLISLKIAARERKKVVVRQQQSANRRVRNLPKLQLEGANRISPSLSTGRLSKYPMDNFVAICIETSAMTE